MARLAVRRTRSPEPDSDEDGSSRAQTPLSTAPNDRKRARRSTRNDENDSDASADDPAPAPSRRLPISSMPTSSQPLNARDANHQPGSIVRVKLTNFVTYSKAEFFPGPSLNMVIGPNGTGKSTLVCAICLGLGWGPQVLGRAKEVGEFVKHGSAEAIIEIELKRQPDKRRNPIITRKIKRDGNKSEWLLNNSASGQNAIRTMAKGFNIHLDNLCQFLPQDKVVEFAQMDPKEVLKSTQEAAGTTRMIECREILIKIREKQKELLAGQRTDKDELDNLTRRQEAQRAEVERLRDREKYQEKMGWLQKAKLIPDFYTTKRTAEEAKADQVKLAKELEQLKKEAGPMLRQLNAKKVYQRDTGNLKNRREKELKEADNKAGEAADAVKAIQQKIDALEKTITADKERAAKAKMDKARIQLQLSKMRRENEQPTPEFDAPVMNAAMSDRQRECGDLEEQNRTIKGQITDLQTQRDTRRTKIAGLEERIQTLDTKAGQTEVKLEEVSKDTARAWKWINENQQIFEKPVFGPPIIVCNVPETRMAVVVENVLTRTDKILITAQTYSDFTLLQNKLFKELKLHDVSLRTRQSHDNSHFPKPYSLEQLEQYGMSSYLIDHIEGPPEVIAQLCLERQIHKTGVTAGTVSSEQHDRMLHSELSGYFSENTVNSFVRRRDLGSGASISRSSRAMPANIWVDQPVDMNRKAAMQRDITEAKGEMQVCVSQIDECKGKIQTASNKIETLRQEIEEIKKDKAAKQKALADHNALPRRIRDAEQSLAKVLEDLDGSALRRQGWKGEIDDAIVDKAEAAVQYADAIRVIKDCMSRLIEAEVQSIEADSDHEVLEEKNKAITEMLATKTAEETEARDKAKEAHVLLRNLMKAAKKVNEEAVALRDEGKPGLLALMEKMRDDKWTPEEYDAEVEATNAQLALTEGGNADAIRTWEERQKKIELLTGRMQTSSTELAEALQAIQEVRREWEPQLEELVSKISDAFADNFSRIGCAGMVEVGKKHSEVPEDCTEEAGGEENGLDFANWTIRISVKFRENEPLSLLDSKRQSGGERAVSTIFYLMALQSLSRAPFRVVDEINQGMDGRNERMVHGRMVDVATAKRDDGGAGGSQYFLITPKLLSGLKYRRGMTVLCIVSGEHVPAEGERVVEDAGLPFKSHPRLDFGQFAKKARELGLGRVGRRVDSGVAMVGA